MKKNFYAIIGIAAMAIACDAQFEIERFAPQDSPRTVTISASLPATRVSVVTSGDDKDKTTWTEGDKIAIWNTSGAKFDFEIETGEDSEYATFKCTTFTGELGSKAVYPAAWAGETLGTITIPEYINWEDNIFPAVMASKVTTIQDGEVEPLYFHSLMPIMEFTLQNIPAYACALKLWSKTGASLHGTWTVNEDCTAFTGETPTGNTQQVIYFPYKTAYGSEGSITIRAAIPAYEYTDLSIRVLDGDEDVIEGTGKKVPTTVINNLKNNLKAYVVMAALNVRTMVGNSRDKYVKVEGVKWAKGNLRAWLGGTDGTDGGADGVTAWQTGWNIYDNQWENQVVTDTESASTKSTTEYIAVTVDGTQQSYYLSKNSTTNQYHHFDHFSWGLLGRAARVHNQCITSNTKDFSIVGSVFDMGGAMNFTAKRIDDKSPAESPFTANSLSDNANLTIAGDIAYWASKGAYKMPTSNQLTKLYNKNSKANANMKAGYYMLDGKKIRGVLFTTSPSWADATTNEAPDNEFTLADMESGLFLPSCGTRVTGSGLGDATRIIHFNKWGSYWSGTWGALENDNTSYDTARALKWSPEKVEDNCSLQNGFTIRYNNVYFGKQYVGNCIRPVYNR